VTPLVHTWQTLGGPLADTWQTVGASSRLAASSGTSATWWELVIPQEPACSLGTVIARISVTVQYTKFRSRLGFLKKISKNRSDFLYFKLANIGDTYEFTCQKILSFEARVLTKTV